MDYTKSSLLATCLVIAAGAFSCPAIADDVSMPPPVAPGPELHAQTQAADNGPSAITLRLQYTGEAAYNALGGIHNGATSESVKVSIP